MAFLHRGIGDSDPGSNFFSKTLLKTLRWAAIPCLGIALVGWSAATLAGLHSAASLAYAGTVAPSPLPMSPPPMSPLSNEAQLRQEPHPAKAAANAKKMLVASAERPVAMASLSPTQTKARLALAAEEPADPFGKIVADAKLSREKLLAAFAGAGMAIKETSAPEPVEVAMAMPSAERFHRIIEDAALSSAAAPSDAISDIDPLSPLALGAIGLNTEIAYAAAEASPQNPVQLALASLALDPYGMDGDEPEISNDIMPDAVDLPPARPQSKPAKADEKPERKPTEIANQEAAPARKPARTNSRDSQQELAYARPDKPEGSVGRAFRNLFNDTPKAGNKVAIYDISAAVVHMPDGTKLEAHSGIGKMADNPRYVHVKMNGPTPPNTYKLSMREKRFHGVEAVRMTPVGEQTMHGRDGILAHSYLLRGGREESHGCVAFANYPKFLKAFKQGKVTHMIVVPSISKAQVRMVSNSGRGT